jgi:hypothetical protein
MKFNLAVRWISVAATLTVLSACNVGQPMDIPVPESQLKIGRAHV